MQAGLAPGRLPGVSADSALHHLAEPVAQPVALASDGALDAVRAWRRGRRSVTAVCAFHDDLAKAVLSAASVLGHRVPDDLAVVGIDDNPASARMIPPLTTVAYGMEAISRCLAATVAARLRATPVPWRTGRPAGCPLLDLSATGSQPGPADQGEAPGSTGQRAELRRTRTRTSSR